MWNERFAEPGFAFGTRPNEFLEAMAGKIPKGRVLCLGDGEGRNGVYLAGLGHEVTAVDSSDVGLKKAAALAAEKGAEIETIHADLADFEIGEGCWDGIVSIFCHLPPDLRPTVHRRCVAGLAEGGAFVLEGFIPRQLTYGTGGPPVAELMMNLHDLGHELDGLRFETAREIDREILEGRYHSGLSAVVQILAYR